MARENKKEFANNTVRIVGVLKENNLEHITDYAGKNVIRGSVIVATSKMNAHKVQFYVSEYTQQGKESSAYTALKEMLPNNTRTIASLLKDDPDLKYEDAFEKATKVWVLGKLDEYAYRTGERVSSMLTIKGITMGASTKENEDNFAEFSVDIYIGKIEPEVDENDKETGRLCVTGYVGKYDKSVDIIEFVAVQENNVAKYIASNYKVGDCVNLYGDLINLQERVQISSDEPKDEGSYFGKRMQDEPSNVTYETRFIHELRITGGSKTPYKKDEVGYLTAEQVKMGLATREIKMDKNGARKNNNTAPSASSQSKPIVRKTTNTSTDSDIDF